MCLIGKVVCVCVCACVCVLTCTHKYMHTQNALLGRLTPIAHQASGSMLTSHISTHTHKYACMHCIAGSRSMLASHISTHIHKYACIALQVHGHSTSSI